MPLLVGKLGGGRGRLPGFANFWSFHFNGVLRGFIGFLMGFFFDVFFFFVSEFF